jgi:hypothetical protein
MVKNGQVGRQTDLKAYIGKYQILGQKMPKNGLFLVIFGVFFGVFSGGSGGGGSPPKKAQKGPPRGPEGYRGIPPGCIVRKGLRPWINSKIDGRSRL